MMPPRGRPRKTPARSPTDAESRAPKQKIGVEDFLKIMPYLDDEVIARTILGTNDFQSAIEPFMPHEEEVGYPTDPVVFMTEILGYQMWDKLEQICRSVEKHHNTVVTSSFSVGKSVTMAALVCWWMTIHEDAKVIIFGPCYDDKTEILTERGWILFADLLFTDKVAQLNGDKMEFIKPEGWVRFAHKGEMIGYKSQLIDFLVTPEHECLVDTHVTRKGAFKWRKLPAKDIFERNVRMRRCADWDGVESGISDVEAEFMGFWCAKGHARKYKQRAEVVVSQKDHIDYAVDLMTRAYPNKHIYRYDRDGGTINLSIYDAELAEKYLNMFAGGEERSNSHTKRIPPEIRNAPKRTIAKFLHGFYMGDGSKDGNSAMRLHTCNELLAGDLQELAIKAGYTANVSHVIIPNVNQKQPYTVCIWRNGRGAYPLLYRSTNTMRGWYKENYDGYVYCVKSTTGVVMVRRNGKPVWSGNTWNQVQNIIFRYIRTVGRKANLPGQILDSPRWEVSSEHFAIGMSPKRSSAEDIAGMSGFHSPHMLVVLDEAAGLPRIIWDAAAGFATSNDSRVVAIGNPIEQAGPFWDASQSRNWRAISISSFDHPNVITGTEVIPGAVTRNWVAERATEWASEVPEGTAEAILLPWLNKWYLPQPMFYSKVMGIAPEQAEDQLIKLAWVVAAQQKLLEQKNVEVIAGLDPARKGGDTSVLVIRYGQQVIRIVRWSGLDVTQLVEKVALELRESGVTKCYVDAGGLGAGVSDYGRKIGLPMIEVISSRAALQRKRFANLRAECWWHLREALREGRIQIPEDNLLMGDLLAPKYFPDMYQRIQIEDKDAIRERIKRSPDTGDALALTYAFPGGDIDADVMRGLQALGRQEGVYNPQAISKWTVQKNRGVTRWRR